MRAKVVLAAVLMVGAVVATSQTAAAHNNYIESWMPTYNQYYEFIYYSQDNWPCGFNEMQGNYGTAAYSQMYMVNKTSHLACNQSGTQVWGCTGLDCPQGLSQWTYDTGTTIQSTLANKNITFAHYYQQTSSSYSPPVPPFRNHRRTV